MSDRQPIPGRHRWPVTLTEGAVSLRPIRARDRRAWNEVRRRNHGWLVPWEPTVPPGGESGPETYGELVRLLRRQARLGLGLPWTIWYSHRGSQPTLAGQLTVSNIAGGAAQSGSIGYWVDERWAGRGIVPTAVAMAIDYCFEVVRLHRIEIAIRPENGRSLRVVEKLQLRQEGIRPRYLHINGAWRDHLIFTVDSDQLIEPMLQRLRARPTEDR